MTSGISETLLSGLSKFVATRMGLHFPGERWRDLEHGVNSASAEFGFEDAGTCIKWLVSSKLMKPHFAMGNLCKQHRKIKESDRHFALALLRQFKNDEIQPESEGITSGRLSEIITSIKGKEVLV